MLNRIDGKAPTRIDGAITQQAGKTFMIYIVNPAGVFFGADAKINVTGPAGGRGQSLRPRLRARHRPLHEPEGQGRERGHDRHRPEHDSGDDPQQIVTNAVSLVGRSVANSGDIDATAGS